MCCSLTLTDPEVALLRDALVALAVSGRREDVIALARQHPLLDLGLDPVAP